MRAPTPEAIAEWSAWRARRVARLRDPEGWLALVGLHWLEEGENRVDGLPGAFAVEHGQVRLRAGAADGYHLEGAPVTERTLRTDADARPDRVRLGSRTVGIIRRGPALAVRVWDAESPALRSFQGIECFPYDAAWRVVARWEGYAAPREVAVPAAAGPPRRALAPGRAHFSIRDQPAALEPTLEADGSLLFVFRDATAPRETYGAGRFLAARPPDAGAVVLDFNRAVNPPCVFTASATCPLASPENVLPVRIEAGEKLPLDHG